jgi:hypothetical protein
MKYDITIHEFIPDSPTANCSITFDNQNEVHGFKDMKIIRDRIVGQQRQDLKFKIAANSSANIRNKIIIEADDPKKVPSINVFHQINYEYKNINNIDTNIHLNIVKCVDFFNILTTTLKELYSEAALFNNISGFVQEYNFKPFGVNLFSEIQINFWKEIQKILPVWYFDATGGCHKQADGRPVYLYTFVCHDYINKLNIPIALFLSSSQTTATISKFLLSIKQSFILNSNKNNSFEYAPVMVTDESWAIINSLCDIFNGHSIKSYIKWTFEILVEYPGVPLLRKTMKTKLFLCHVHFLYNAIKKIKVLNLDKENQDIFVYGFIGLQNCKSIEEFTSIFESLFLIFNSKFCQLEIIEKAKDLIISLRTDKVNLSEDQIQEDKVKLCCHIDALYINDNFHGI